MFVLANLCLRLLSGSCVFCLLQRTAVEWFAELICKIFYNLLDKSAYDSGHNVYFLTVSNEMFTLSLSVL